MDPLVLERQAREFAELKNWEKAAEVYAELLTRIPVWEHGGGDFEYALCLDQLGRHAEALAHFRLAHYSRPHDDSFLEALANALERSSEPLMALNARAQLTAMNQAKSEENFAKLWAFAKSHNFSEESVNKCLSKWKKRYADYQKYPAMPAFRC